MISPSPLPVAWYEHIQQQLCRPAQATAATFTTADALVGQICTANGTSMVIDSKYGG